MSKSGELLEISREGERAVVTPERDVVASSVAVYRPALRGLVEDGVRDILVDLSRVQMVDSSGLGLLIAVHNSLGRVGGKLEITGLSADLLYLFQALRLQQRIRVVGAEAQRGDASR